MVTIRLAASNIYSRYGAYLILSATFLIPLRLAPSLVFLIPLILLWLIRAEFSFSRLVSQHRVTVLPLLAWLGVAFVSALFGRDPLRSFQTGISSFFFLLAAPVVSDFTLRLGYKPILLALFSGQTLAAIHSVLEALFPGVVPPIFVGKVSESGQIAMTLVTLIGFLYQSKKTDREGSFATRLSLSASMIFICAAFVINLKRGPWVGVAVATVIFFSRFSKRLLLPFVVAVAAIAISFTPVRERLGASYNHFFIQGGRFDMWAIAVDISSRYPIGIGYNNSKFMREYDQHIVPGHSHFHNNLLNVLVETGWIGLFIFFWWIVGVIRAALTIKSQDSSLTIMSTSIGLALLSWQIAGMVEYNFGDSEVRLIAYILLGILSAFLIDAPKLLHK